MVLRRPTEPQVVMSLVHGPRVLDVGCGNGRYLRLLRSAGHLAIGIDLNPSTVTRVRSDGFEAFEPDEFFQLSVPPFDTILMSHVLEHMMPAEMISCVDAYLDHLAPDGSLVVASPLMHSGFYDDYDHMRPYTPRALVRVFGPDDQFRQKPRHELRLESVWFRKQPRVRPELPAAEASPAMLYRRLLNAATGRVFRLSGNRLGVTTGWVGRFAVVGENVAS